MKHKVIRKLDDELARNGNSKAQNGLFVGQEELKW
jgi:hypothetical protein